MGINSMSILLLCVQSSVCTMGIYYQLCRCACRELVEDGRADLRYAMQLHSHHSLAIALRLQDSTQGGHNHKNSRVLSKRSCSLESIRQSQSAELLELKGVVA